MNTKRILAALTTFAALVALALPVAAEDTPAPVHRPHSAFRLDYQIYELEAGKHVNERSYTLVVNEGGSGIIRIGSRVPIVLSEEKGVQYQDVGLRIESRIFERDPGDVALEAEIDVSSFAIPEQAETKGTPLLRTLSQKVSARPALGRPTLLASVDDVSSKKRTQVEVTVTRLK